jgi:hypothetical protein
MPRRGSRIWLHSLEPLDPGPLSAQAPGARDKLENRRLRGGRPASTGASLLSITFSSTRPAMTDKRLPRGNPADARGHQRGRASRGRGSGDPLPPADRARNTPLRHPRFSAFRATRLCGRAYLVRGVLRRSRRAARLEARSAARGTTAGLLVPLSLLRLGAVWFAERMKMRGRRLPVVASSAPDSASLHDAT